MNDKIKESIKSIDIAIEDLKQKEENIKSQIKQLEQSKNIICKANNICLVCLGTGEIYNKKKAMEDNDPYSRSSDFYETCSNCQGTGKFIE